jgi:hypothetical protein
MYAVFFKLNKIKATGPKVNVKKEKVRKTISVQIKQGIIENYKEV